MTRSGGKELVIGLGTGRCGTVSLARILSEQHGVSALHEGGASCGSSLVCPDGVEVGARIDGHLPWAGDPDLLRKRVDALLSLPGNLVGDTAFYYLPYVELIRKTCPVPVSFVCMRRDKEQTGSRVAREQQ